MYRFDYHRPSALHQASALVRGRPEAKFLAGGMSLLSAMKLRLIGPSDLVDLSGIDELNGVSLNAGQIAIGGMSRHAVVAASPVVQIHLPVIATLAAGIGDRQVRNRGTIGGSLANNDPSACYPAGVLGLDAAIETDRRSIKADDFFVGMFETALEPDEIIVRVRFSLPRRAAYVKFHQPASRFALVGVLVSELENGEIRVAVTGAGACVFRCREVERALQVSWTPEAAESANVPADGLNSDIHAASDYRAHLIRVLAGRAVASLQQAS
ncbi:MAG: xanthine dehydrogenase family protein subunit M [Pseudorhodoplanes sp.]|uniref:FAD binding domain-containing protein n=1 Tax=Pseudorhodoplanes sp. TaxID=1934341 RepID=UPI003D0DAEB2